MSSYNDLYPERRGGHVNPSVLQRATGAGHPASLKVSCERECVWNMEQMPMVQHMISALRTAGCPVDISRHVSCDMCQTGTNIEHAGGYDPATNQVIIKILGTTMITYLQVFVCSNNATNTGLVHGALVRNLIQMFDVCVNKYDFYNAEHLACTEIRKANLANCGYLVYMQQKWASFNWKKAHAQCVKNTAVDYLVSTKFVKEDVAKAAVDKVFDKCYNDLEPIGRRSIDADDIARANSEKYIFGYF